MRGGREGGGLKVSDTLLCKLSTFCWTRLRSSLYTVGIPPGSGWENVSDHGMWVVRWQTLVVLALLPDVTLTRHATAKIFPFSKISDVKDKPNCKWHFTTKYTLSCHLSYSRLDNSKLGSTQQQKICWHWYIARIISSRKIYGLYALKHHIVEMRGDVTDVGRTNDQ